jgi:hypothetical protein
MEGCCAGSLYETPAISRLSCDLREALDKLPLPEDVGGDPYKLL